MSNAMESGMRTLTGDADVGLAALGGPRGAPGHTLTPEVLGPEQLLHLLPGDLDAGFSYDQACGDRARKNEREAETEVAHGRRERAEEHEIRKVLVYINRENGGPVRTKTDS